MSNYCFKFVQLLESLWHSCILSVLLLPIWERLSENNTYKYVLCFPYCKNSQGRCLLEKNVF